MLFRQISDDRLAQYAYLIGCQRTGEALLVDPQRDIDRYQQIAANEGLKIVAVSETHIHADFLSGAREFAAQDPNVTVYLSDEGDADWKYEWARDGGDKIKLVRDGDVIQIGKISVGVKHTPGHTPEHLCFSVTDGGAGAESPMGVLSGDFVFVGDLGRPDLLETAAGEVGAREPSARRLYQSTLGFLSWPEHLQLWPGHGAGSACGKALGAVPQSTVGYEQRYSEPVSAARDSEQAFVENILSGQPEPPLYFARMKKLNKMGPPILGALPQPAALDVKSLAERAQQEGAFILDARQDRNAFLRGHLPGAIFAPFNKSFPTIAGSYVNPASPIYLVIESRQVEEAVRSLIRIGLDKIAGFIEPHSLSEAPFVNTIASCDFTRVRDERNANGVSVVDVRRQSEFDAGHVPDAINIAHTRLADRLDELPKNDHLLVHCLSGGRAASAVSFLAREGYDVTLVDAPFASWSRVSEPA